MEITEAQLLSKSYLTALGVEARRLLCEGAYGDLASRFGYALAYERDPALAIRLHLESALKQLGARSLEPSSNSAPIVRYFGPNEIVLAALIEVWVQTDSGKNLLVELVVTGKEANRHVVLEHISAAA